MKIALICLAAGVGLGQLPSLVTSHATRSSAAPSSTEATSTYTAPQPLAFSQYAVANPQTITIADDPAGGSTGSTAEQIFAAATTSGTVTTSTLTPAPADIADNVSRGVSQMNEALKTAPVAMARMSESVAKNGIIAALAYDDPAVRAQTNKLSAQMGDSLRNFAEALAKDMNRSVRESGIQAQSVSGR
ncbi:hypothetical protein [Ottowia sp.]|uniref:hypothetical protein n=1 Tax=Ottowia sp. TaxID=1898956 RepID=UPI0025E75FAA|nr:hypothetical protein [Ottowia sp.]MBK6616092.1 hypothetical protein [Ottowia sp.]